MTHTCGSIAFVAGVSVEGFPAETCAENLPQSNLKMRTSHHNHGADRFRRRDRDASACDRSCSDSQNGASTETPKRTISLSPPDPDLSAHRMRVIVRQRCRAGPDHRSLAPEAEVDSMGKTTDSRERPLTSMKEPTAGVNSPLDPES